MERSKEMKPNFWGHVVHMTLFLFVVWCLLSGKWEAKFLIMGAVFSFAVACISVPCLVLKNQKTGKLYYMFDVGPKFIGYCFWLLWQIVLAAWDVTTATLNMKRVEPSIIYFKMDYENPSAAVLLTNSIILTPGTITLSVTDDGVYEIHSLTKVAADGLMGGDMQNRVAKLFGETCTFEALPGKTITDIPKEVD